MRRHIKQVNLAGKVVDAAWKKSHPKEIYFDSMFERNFYLKLQDAGLDFTFHPAQRELVASFKTPALSRGKEEKFILSTVRPIRYTPDFAIYVGTVTIFIETKGFFEDGARLRYKLFQKSLKKNELTFIVYDMREANKLLKIIVENFTYVQKALK